MFNKTLVSLFSGTFLPVLFSTTAMAQDDSSQQIYQPDVAQAKQQAALSHKARRDNLYFIQLVEQPLASYNGDLLGYSATSILSSHGSNTNSKGLLNVNSVNSKNYLSYLSGKQSRFITEASNALTRKLTIEQSYKLVLNALAVKLSASEAKIIAQQENVKSVEKVGMHYIQTDSGPEFIGAKNVWQGDSQNTGSKGEGVIVGIIDTGINASHPAFADIGGDGFDHTNPLGQGNYLGDCQEFSKFCNDKLIGIISYPEIVNARPAIQNSAYSDLEDKMKVGYDFNAHGTHVASTAAGNILKQVPLYLSVSDDEGDIVEKSNFTYEQVSGVAPHANIVSYQVCDDNGCYTELTIKALEHAIANGINVINYSVGGGAQDPWASAQILAFLNARVAGLHIATSAGNSGPDAKTIGSPGNAPWITTVAAYTHDRAFSEKALSNFSGGSTVPDDIKGLGATAAFTAKVVLAKDYGSTDAEKACNEPFAADTFDGEIVVCERGDIARVRKGVNVKSGGAGGMILANTEAGTTSLNADTHVLPVIHISYENSLLVTNWLASGTDHQLSITASSLIKDLTKADIAAPFSSRGPNLPFAEIFAPDVAGPGVDIYAANAEDHPFEESRIETPYTTMSGTSMSSPHVAGALALIYSVHPDWTPSQVQSALMTTAQHVTYKDDDGDGVTERSTFFDQGAGSIRIDAAIKAGLLLNITEQQYLDAAPTQGGEPAALNSASMVAENCIIKCTWSRTVTAAQDATWTASYEYISPGVDISVTPTNFTLTAGQSQQLTITASANIDLVDKWTHGFVTLTPSSDEISTTRLQVLANLTAGSAPNVVEAQVNNVNDTVIVADVITAGSNDLQVRGFGLFKVNNYSGYAIGAAEGVLPYQDPATTYSVPIVVPPYTKRLIVDITATNAPDMDLYVGIDSDNNGLPDYWELNSPTTCISGRFDSLEHCDIENPVAGSYWVIAHNFAGTAVGASDKVELAIGLIKYTDEPTFEISAPASIAQDKKFDIGLAIEGAVSGISTEEIKPGKKYYGLLEIGTTASLKTNVGSVLLSITGGPHQVTVTGGDQTITVGDKLDYLLNLPENNTSAPVNYTVAIELPEKISLNTATVEPVSSENTLTWQLTQAVDSEAAQIAFSLDTGKVTQTGHYQIVASYRQDNSDSIALSVASTLIQLPVQALINGSNALTLEVTEGDGPIALSGAASTGIDGDDVLSYNWTQTSGSTLALSASDGAEASFIVPKNIAATTTYSYQLSVSNGTTSNTALVTIKVSDVVAETSPEKKSSGGAFSFGLCCLLGLSLGMRRRKSLS